MKTLVFLFLVGCGEVVARPTMYSYIPEDSQRGLEISRAIADLNSKAGCELVHLVPPVDAEWAISIADLGLLSPTMLIGKVLYKHHICKVDAGEHNGRSNLLNGLIFS